MRLAEYENGTCPCGCGLQMDVAHSKEQTFMVDTFTCQAGRVLQIAKDKAREAAEKANKPDGWDHGKHYYVRPIDDDREGRDRGN